MYLGIKNNLIRKNLIKFYGQYLNIIRSKIKHLVKESLDSLFDISYEENNINDEKILSVFNQDIDLLVNKIMPFLTIEQLGIPIVNEDDVYDKGRIAINTKFLFDSNSEKILNDNRIDILKEERLSHFYYDSIAECNSNSSIDLDNNSFKETTNIGYDEENELIFSLLDLSQKETNNINSLETKQEDISKCNHSELRKLLSWTNTIDSSIRYRMKEFSVLVNKELSKKKIIKKFIPDNVLELLLENQFLVANPLPFIILFDLNTNEFINNTRFINETDFSKIYLFNLNSSELEFYDIKLNLLRNKITDLKKELKTLIKKEKYWNTRKINIDLNNSTFN